MLSGRAYSNCIYLPCAGIYTEDCMSGCYICNGGSTEGMRPGEVAIVCKDHIHTHTVMMESDKYSELRKVLDLAFRRASTGKGHERHGSDSKRFEHQQVFSLLDIVDSPLSPLDYQIIKKTLEATRMYKPGTSKIDEITDPIGEMLDVIVYAAIKILRLRQ